MARFGASLLAALALGSVLPAQLRCKVYTSDRIRTVRLLRGEWFAPEEVQRIEVDTSAAARPGDVLEAWAGKHAWPFSIDPHKDVQVIEVDERIREAWRQQGALTVGFATQRASGGELVLRAGLRRLDLPAEGVQITLVQRHRTDIQGSDGYLQLHIDDITAGQVLLDVRGADGVTFVRPRSVREGDRVDIDLGDAHYVLVVKRLVNILIGDDHGVFALYEREPAELQRIEALLRRVESSPVKFVREGREYDGAAAAAHLRRKYGAVHDRITTLDQFIEQIGSRSSTTGEPYQIALEDGTTVPSAQWLREQAAALPPIPDLGGRGEKHDVKKK